MDKITSRESEVLELIAKGWSNQQIADELCIAVDTVKGHVHRILNRLDMDNRMELVRYTILNEISGNGHPGTVVISPHPDDEVLGCYTFLKGATVIYVTTSHPLYPHGDNINEAKNIAKKLGFTNQELVWYAKETNKLCNIPISELIDTFEKTLNDLKPTTVLIPNPSYNQDHRTIYDATLTAMRHHDRNHFVKRILLYEDPQTWDTLRKPEPFKANYYRPVDIDAKLEAIQMYHSQMRAHRSLDYIKAIAKVRGQQSNMPYAEAFEVVRWCE